MKKLWIVGRIFDGKNDSGKEWSFQGVFDSEKQAIVQCLDYRYFIGPAIINETIPTEDEIWPGSYYPKKDKRESTK